jgi:tetratricopeptide (TPR) repeat protein
VVKVSSLRSGTILVLACLLLPFVASCSGEKGADAAKGTDRDPPPLTDPVAARLNKAIDEAAEAIGRDPKGVNERGESAYARRGRAYAEKGEHDKAIADYSDAIQLYLSAKGPYYTARLTEARNGRAGSYAKRRDLDKAIADYTDIIESTPTGGTDLGIVIMLAGVRGSAFYHRGICYDEKGDHATALEDYTEALRLAPELAKTTDVKQRMSK